MQGLVFESDSFAPVREAKLPDKAWLFLSTSAEVNRSVLIALLALLVWSGIALYRSRSVRRTRQTAPVAAADEKWKERYELCTLRDVPVYRLRKRHITASMPQHYICPTCYERKNVKGFLKPMNNANGDSECTLCKERFPINFLS